MIAIQYSPSCGRVGEDNPNNDDNLTCPEKIKKKPMMIISLLSKCLDGSVSIWHNHKCTCQMQKLQELTYSDLRGY